MADPFIHHSYISQTIFTWLKHLKLVKAYTCKLKLVKICYQLKYHLELWLSNQILRSNDGIYTKWILVKWNERGWIKTSQLCVDGLTICRCRRLVLFLGGHVESGGPWTTYNWRRSYWTKPDTCQYLTTYHNYFTGQNILNTIMTKLYGI